MTARDRTNNTGISGMEPNQSEIAADARQFKPVEMQNKTLAEVLGEIAWLLSQDKFYKHRSLASLEIDIMPALMRGQFKTFYARQADPSNSSVSSAVGLKPVAFAAWVLVDDETAHKVASEPSLLARLDFSGAISGNIPVVSIISAPFGGFEQILSETREHLSNIKGQS